MHRYTLSTQAVIARSLLALLGGYVLALSFCIGFTAILVRGFSWARADAFFMAAMCALLVWVGAALVSFTSATTARASYRVLGTATILLAIGWILSPLPAPTSAIATSTGINNTTTAVTQPALEGKVGANR